MKIPMLGLLTICLPLVLLGQSSGQALVCSTHQTEGFMTSWAGQASANDHSESRSITRGTHFACLAFAAHNSDVSPACVLSFDNGRTETLVPHHAFLAPQNGVVTLTCNGKSPTCCKVQVTPDSALLKNDNPKVSASPRTGTTAAQVITSITDANGNRHPATAALRNPASVKCTFATGNNPQQNPPSCFITAPGYSGTLARGQSIGTSGPGTVSLTCNGQAPLRCSAQIQ